MPTHASLIARLEQAKEGSRELDGEIWEIIDPDAYRRNCSFIGLKYAGMQYTKATKRAHEKLNAPIYAPKYTTSLDAALTLVPEGWQWNLSGRGTLPDTLTNQASLHRGAPPYYDSEEIDVCAVTTAIALCIAALKARTTP